MLAVSIFSFSRLILVKSLPTDEENKSVCALRDMARARAEQISNLYLEEISEKDDNQISIDELLFSDAEDFTEEQEALTDVIDEQPQVPAQTEEIAVPETVIFEELPYEEAEITEESEAEDEENTGN